jgi:predicted ATPase/transcriptional regulator with XRE-family HTH domain
LVTVFAVGSLLRRHREAAGLTQEELAERAGLSARSVSDIERGLRTRLYPDTAARLATALSLADQERSTFLDLARGRRHVPNESSGLPRPLTSLAGRESEVRTVVAALDAGCRLVSITGLGGIGKTRVALAAAESLMDRYAGQVRFLAVPPEEQGARLPVLIRRSVGASARPGDLAALLKDRPCLLVADALEHAHEAASYLHDVLVSVPELQVLATSRVRLGIPGEQQVALGPLPVDSSPDGSWDQAPAVRLFLDRARDVRPDLTADRTVVIDICRRLSGIPLALELAAARVPHVSLGLLRDRLLDLQEPGSLLPGHPSIIQTLRWALAGLDSHATAVLRACALFPGGWRLDAAETLAPPGADVLAAITTLVDRGLVFLDPQSVEDPHPRWRMLDVVREFVLGEPADGPEAELRAAFQSFYLDLLAEARVSMGREREWFRLLASEEDNVQAALRFAEEAGDAETLLRVATGMWLYWQSRGALLEGRRWLDTGLALQPPAADATKMMALWGNGWLAYHQADDAAVERCANELHAAADRSHDPAALRNSATLRGMLAIARDDPTTAVALLREALGLARSVGDEWIIATSYLNLGLGHLSASDVHSAQPALGEALRVYELLKDERFHARCLGYLGMAALLADDTVRARSLFSESLRAFHRLAEPGGTAEGLSGLAAIAAAVGEPTKAAVLGGAAEAVRLGYGGRELPLDRRTTERYLAKARKELGPRGFEAAVGLGRALDLERVLEFALGRTDEGGDGSP